ncbi:MAG TPA: isoleucine--tRNA ligase [Candidatus Nanoarchaeia archaeon]|nr:isoleucine--tRNA ligase [Candidatus Nanoarchaeia archaeon]
MYNFKEIEGFVETLWKKHSAEIKKSLEYDKKKKLFGFLEGPPTANAPPALHHVEVRVFKDLFCRFKYMQGFTVPRKGGWDCHGLPIEVQIEKVLKLNSKKDILDYGVEKFNKKCRESVFSYINEWNKLTEKMAYWIDLENPYVTLDNNYIESVWWSLKEMHKKGLLYEGHKVVPLCPRCETPLSSHEVALGYKDVSDPSIFVTFKLKSNPSRFFLVFTTTPWTLFSNLALAVKSNAFYTVVKYKDKEYIIAENLVSKHFENPKIIERIKGNDLVNLEYAPLFDNFKNTKPAFKIISADFVSLEEGTGIVHLAPAFGEDDYQACKAHNLAFVQPVSTEGRFTQDVKEFHGRFVKDCDEEIIELLDARGLLFKKEKISHSYPFCWRCSTPLLYYAMKSWFINVTKFKDKLLKNNKKIKWYPETIKEGRFGDWLNNVKDWALSRSKFWGTPLPIWRCESGHDTIIGSKKELKEKGDKVSEDLDLHKPYVDQVSVKCDKCKKEAVRVPDVIDCWYDSGSAIFAQWHYPFENKEMFEKSFPYDFIAEAIDQTRGWFYTLHVLGTLLFDDVAYKSVVCAGLIVDDKGEKMSKSKGNVLDPDEVFSQVGVDAVRLQFCSTEPGDQKKFTVKSINESVTPFLNILWNCSIVLGNFKSWKKTKLDVEDKWILSRINSLIKEYTDELEQHKYNRCIYLLQYFVNEDLSRNYIKFVRERINNGDSNVGYCLNYVFSVVVRLLAPFAPYISEYLYQNNNVKKDNVLVHLSSWPKCDEKLVDKKIENSMESCKVIIQGMLSARDAERLGVRWPIKSSTIYLQEPYKKVSSEVKPLLDMIKVYTNVKEIKFIAAKKSLDNEIKGIKFEYGNVTLDTNLTKELEEEGFSRELIRRIQDLRRKAGLKREDSIELFIDFDFKFGKKFISAIKNKTSSSKIYWNKDLCKFYSEGDIKNKKFWIGLNLK